MLSNAYFLARFRFDTAENEPAKSLQKFANFPSAADELGKPRNTTATGGTFLFAATEVAGSSVGEGDKLCLF